MSKHLVKFKTNLVECIEDYYEDMFDIEGTKEDIVNHVRVGEEALMVDNKENGVKTIYFSLLGNTDLKEYVGTLAIEINYDNNKLKPNLEEN